MNNSKQWQLFADQIRANKLHNEHDNDVLNQVADAADLVAKQLEKEDIFIYHEVE